MDSKKIAVIGAGPMGLAVAYQLIKDGYKPIIFEADDRIGGMTSSFDFSGLEIERYYHFHCTSDQAFFEILKELNLEDKLNWKNTKMGYFYKNRVQEWGNPIALLKFSGLSLIDKFRYGLHAFYSTKLKNWQQLEKYDAKSWIKKWIGEKAFEILWDKLLKLKFYGYSDNLSAPWIWSRIRRIGNSRYSIFAEKLGYLNGGSKTLLNKMAEFIKLNGGEILLNSRVKKIYVNNNSLGDLETESGIYRFDKIISTIPLPIISQIIHGLSEELQAKLSSKKNIAVVCGIVKLNKKLTNNFWLNINDENIDIPGIIEYSNLNPDVGNILYIPYYMPREESKFSDSDEIFINKIKRYFKIINSEIDDSDFIDIKINRYFYAQPICEPNYLNSLPDIEIAKNLFVADTSYYYPEDRGISESIDFGRKLAKNIKDV